MRIALLTDLHANRDALAACLAHAEQHGAERYAFLGDLVGYGADPGWVVDTVMSYAAQGAIVVLGNHDSAVVHEGPSHMHAEAQLAVEWTRAQLNLEQRDFLAKLPFTAEQGDCLFVHASADAPDQWNYIFDVLDATRSFYATNARVTFCGHVHEPSLFNMSATGKVSSFTPIGDSNIPLPSSRRWLAIPGAVGQPRDGNPAAAYAVFDDATHDLTFYRVPYDCEAAARKIIAAGLPVRMGQRLLIGL
ncbi:MAG: metallophosphoesterase family protein [Burkholderiales bacterium]|nr:metallophosphoesterase family protein [Burkholderiales bacterium]